MNNENRCNKYENFFIFNNEEVFNEHLKNCPDCQAEHEKFIKISELVKEVAPQYLEKQKNIKKLKAVKKLACCFIAFIGLTSFTGYKLYISDNYQSNYQDDSYIMTMGLPTDDYGFLDL